MSAAERDDPKKIDRAPAPPVRFDRFELDEANARFLRDGKIVPLAPTPFAMLCALIRQPGSLLTKQALLDEIWGHQFVSESVLKTVISDLRTLLKDDARQPRFIETVSRRGYRFVATAITVARGESNAHAVAALQATPLVGRREALSQLHAIWDHARAGKRSIVWVTGEPGIGKTTLVEHFTAGLGDTACVRGQCVEQYGGGEPYLPVLEALGDLCRRDAAVVPVLRAVAPTWLVQLPWLSSADERDALRRELAGVGADRALREMGEFLDRYTEQRPLLLVTEDLHWSDRATIQLIDYVARRRSNARLMWLATFRLTEIVALDHPLSQLRRELRLHGQCEEIVLDPFSGEEVAEYVAQRAPSIVADEAFVRVLQERTDGLPLFVASVVSELADRAGHGHEVPTAAAHVAGVAVPENLAAIIDRYIGRLGDDDRIMLSAAAICGVEFRVATVASAIGRDQASVGQACDKLEREGLWLAASRRDEHELSAGTTYSFRHALFRQVLYERTAPLRRIELHRKVGAALESERAAGATITAAELAAHFGRGRELVKAVEYCAEAAEAALLHFSPLECRTLAEHGLGMLDRVPSSADRDALEMSLATLSGVSASHLLGLSSSEAKTSFTRAYALLDQAPQHRMRGWLLHSLGVTLVTRAEYPEALAVADHTELLSSATEDAVLMVGACVVRGDVHMLQGRPADACTWFERGLSSIASLGESRDNQFLADPQVTMLALLAVQLLHRGQVESARSRVHEARSRAHAGAQPMTQMIAVWFETLFELRLGDVARVATLAVQMQTLVDEFALAQGRTAARWFLGWATAHRGKPREGYELIRGAYEENTRLGMISGASETLGYAAEALLLADDLNGARKELDEALQISRKYDERIYLPQLFLIEAAIARSNGESRVATDSVRRAIAEAQAQRAAWFELLAFLELFEHGGATADDRRKLASLTDEMPEASGTAAFAKARTLVGKANS